MEEGSAPGTIEIYSNYLSRFIAYCSKHSISSINEIILATLLYLICEVENIRQQLNGGLLAALN
ncbi:hypothetical protein [Pedobacter sp. CG_S7]|uniref:hypothetical protein n=1 Tax=Pedobacter sp. CG_S7 TaxID=3143930 RepID=UPI00339A360D